MRSDLAKVFFDEPRRGSRTTVGIKTALKINPNLDHDDLDLPIRFGRRARNYNTYGVKSKNYNFSPLTRFLEKSVGRSWDDVYSEICSISHNNSRSDFQLRHRVEEYVSFPGDIYHRYGTFFVDEQGILQKNEPWNRHYKMVYGPVEKIEFPDGLCFELRKGLWFEVVDQTEFGKLYRQINKRELEFVKVVLACARTDNRSKFNKSVTLHIKDSYIRLYVDSTLFSFENNKWRLKSATSFYI